MKTYTFHVSLPGHGRVWRKLELVAEATLEDLHVAIQSAYDFDADHLYSFFMSGKPWDSATEYSLPDGAGSFGDFSVFEGEATEDALLDPEAEDVALPASADMRTMFAALKENPEMREQFLQEFAKQTGIPASMAEMVLSNIGTLMDDVSDEELDEILETDGEDEEDIAGDVRTTSLDSLALKKGKTFLYLFDYGDEWRFKVKVEAVNNKADPNAAYPRLVEAVGEAPAQYADWEEEEEESEEDGEGI